MRAGLVVAVLLAALAVSGTMDCRDHEAVEEFRRELEMYGLLEERGDGYVPAAKF